MTIQKDLMEKLEKKKWHILIEEVSKHPMEINYVEECEEKIGDDIETAIKALEENYVDKEWCYDEIRKLSRFETERIKQLKNKHYKVIMVKVGSIVMLKKEIKQLKTENINLNLDKVA